MTSEYWEGANLTHLMANAQWPHWERALAPYKEQVKEVLEIGSYEGQSALFWHGYFGASVSCLDNWQNFADGCASAAEVQAHFDANTRGRPIYKLQGDSTPGLYWLTCNKYTYDLIYIDGDHSADQVMIDSIMAWKCLRPNGIMIWDDYHDAKAAIDFFCASHGATTIEYTYVQLIVQKRGA